jgi:hypothetical protein
MSRGVLSTMRSPTSPRPPGAGRRLLLRGLLGVALVAGAAMLVTGFDDDRAAIATDGVQLEDLRAMVLPREKLGLLAIGLPESDSSGWERNRAAAADSFDPDDTRRSLAKAGRLGGYSLAYSQPSGFASPSDQRPVLVATEVELFRDEASASAYLHHQLAVAMRLRGKRLPNGRIAGVEPFGGGEVGEESEGLRQSFVANRDVGFGTTVGFRRGRVVASVSVLHQIETSGPGDLDQIAAALDDQIEAVAAGATR